MHNFFFFCHFLIVIKVANNKTAQQQSRFAINFIISILLPHNPNMSLHLFLPFLQKHYAFRYRCITIFKPHHHIQQSSLKFVKRRQCRQQRRRRKKKNFTISSTSMESSWLMSKITGKKEKEKLYVSTGIHPRLKTNSQSSSHIWHPSWH